MSRGFVAAALATLAVALVHAQSDTWRHWQFVAPVTVPAGTPATLAGFVMTPDLVGRAQTDWADLRLIDDAGREVPFVIRERHGERRFDLRPGRVIDRGWVPGESSQAVVDLGEQPAVHNHVTLTLDGGPDVATWLEIASSGDGRAWTVVRDRAPIYSLHQAGIGEWLQATYPESSARYLRVRILDGARRFDVTGASVAREVATAPDLAPAPVTFGMSASPSSDRSVYASSPPTPGLNIGELRFTTSDPLFERPVLVESSDDGRNWARAMDAAIYRTQAPAPAESTVVRVDTASASYWRITIYNRNDQPLHDLKIAPFEMPRRVVFRYEPGRAYRVLVGNSRASRPQYDLARTTTVEAFDTAATATVGAPEPQIDYADPRPWTEQHPIVLWGAVGFAVLVIGALALRTMRHS
jgi:hypothetical protein